MSEPSTTSPVTVLVDGRPVACQLGRRVFNEVTTSGVFIQTACGGQGTCFLCRVTVLAGADKLPPPTAAEQRGLGNVLVAHGMRLSCQIPVVEGLAIRRPSYESASERRERRRRDGEGSGST